jgi:choline dehydrogenase-like flavoprotein
MTQSPDRDPAVSPTDAEVVVVGAGHNSLVAAAYLARAGLDVLVLEAAATVGGNTRTEELTLPGFAHDSCSSAHVLIQNNPLVRDDELGLVADHGLRYLTTDPAVVMPQPDGDVLVMRPDLEATAAELARWSGRDARAFEAMVAGWLELRAPPARRRHHPRLPRAAAAQRVGRGPRELRAPGGALLRAVAGDGDHPGPAAARDRVPPVLAGRGAARLRLDDAGRRQPGAAGRAGARDRGPRRPGRLLGTGDRLRQRRRPGDRRPGG